MRTATNNRLNVFIQYPICDIRSLLVKDKRHLKPFPTWDNPIPTKHFVQYFGHLKRRRKGGHDYFHDELYFINGKGGFKLPKLEKVIYEEIRDLQCIFRRLLNDGNSSIRYEVGFTTDKTNFVKFFSKDDRWTFRKLVGRICQIPVQIKNLEENPINTSVLHCGKWLSALYEKASESDYHDEMYDFPLVRQGEMCIVIEYFVSGFRVLHEENYVAPGLHLSFDWHEVEGKNVGVFLLGKTTGYDLKTLRKTRIGIMRTFAEHQNLTNVLNFVKMPDLEFDADKLSRYLNEKTKFFNKKNEVIKNLILSYYSLIRPEEISAIESRLDQLRMQVKKKVWDHLGEASLKYMLAAEDISEVKKVVSQLISKDKVKQSIQVLKTTIGKLNQIEFEHSVIGIEARFYTLQKAIIDGTMGFNEMSIEQNKLRLSILTLASMISEEAVGV